MFQRWSQPIHAHPMTYRATEEGFELGLPTQALRADVGGSLELSYPHVPAIVVAPNGLQAQGRAARRSSPTGSPRSAWPRARRRAHGHGAARQPLQLLRAQQGRRALPAGGPRRRAVRSDAGRAATRESRRSRSPASPYAIFAPTGSTWEWTQPTELVLRLPADARYFSVAGLPDASEVHAAATSSPSPTPSRRTPASNGRTTRPPARSARSTACETVAREGQNLATFMGLYPHHWSGVVSDHPSQVRLRLGARPHPPGAGQQLHARAHLQRLRPDVGRPAGPGQQGERRQPARRGPRQGAADVQQDGPRHVLDRQGPGRERAADERGGGRGQDEDARRAPRATQGPPGIVVRRAALDVLRPGLHARNLRWRTRGVRQHQGDERPSLPLRLLGDGRRARRAPGSRVGVAAELGRHGRQGHRRHRDRRARPRGLPVPAQLRSVRGALVGLG